VAVGWPIGPNVALRSALPLLGLVLGLPAPGRSAAQEPPLPAPELVPVAAADTAARNAHDLPAVRARFAPDAEGRARHGEVPGRRRPALTGARAAPAPTGRRRPGPPRSARHTA
jgi:hypothetical protein